MKAKNLEKAAHYNLLPALGIQIGIRGLGTRHAAPLSYWLMVSVTLEYRDGSAVAAA